MNWRLLSILLLSCTDSKNPETADTDQDGFSIQDGDCDDSSPVISPEADDIVGDEIDQNCDGIDGVDSDGDSF